MIAFGPVPSRRLGRSLGINNIPAKICTFACVYCQLGNTIRMQVKREAFYPPEEVFESVKEKVEEARNRGEKIDYLAFVPDGEPTLDLNVGREIELLRTLAIPIAVITNASLIHQESVRNALLLADWVSLKVDAVTESVWRRVDRPHGSLKLNEIHRGMIQFAREFEGTLTTETMLVEGINDDEEEFELVADFLASLPRKGGNKGPDKAYISIPTRPPAEEWCLPASEDAIAKAYHTLAIALGEDRVEYLIGYEGNAFASTGNAADDLLSITAVHPMRKEAVQAFLKKVGADWKLVADLIDSGRMMRLEYQGHEFYMRKLPGREKRRTRREFGSG